MNYWDWGRGEGAKAGLQSSSTYPLPTVVCTSMQVVVSNQMLGEGAHEWLQGWVLTNNAHMQNQVGLQFKGIRGAVGGRRGTVAAGRGDGNAQQRPRESKWRARAAGGQLIVMQIIST